MTSFGLELPCGAACADPRLLAELARRAEDAGWDGVFLEDYLVYHAEPDCPTADVWVALAAMAGATSSVRLGTTVTGGARHLPWELARRVSTLDQLSGGRVVLGLGVGDPNDDAYRRFGGVSDPRTRASLLDESLRILVGLFAGERFSFAGAHFQVDDVRFERVRVPIWIGGGWPGRAGVRRAARHDGFLPYRHSSTDRYADAEEELSAVQVVSILDTVRAERGSLEGFDLVVGGRRRRTDWSAERLHVAAVAEAGATWWMEWVPPGPPDEMRAAVSQPPLRP
ncbi:Luciferase-like monooxygenase [Asanoa hainanensis]|uniref:Luciferase-like monooxygenase n=1 Tax=Asanoa hainanensis TaxID=560556 RepID=A0A239MTI9_9ACTN|nr:LLM class flavin-dependent oxidoreductase [Asanoa hainanensis]SNT45563.1 Luciferase-like monooxygenase [Asanoa hainanensis]